VSASEPLSPSYEELVALVAGLSAQLERAHARIAELEARLGRDSRNSSIPPSADSIEAKAKRRADRSSRERSKDRKPGGQPGRKGSGLAPAVAPDRTETLLAPADCSGCGADLADGVDVGMSSRAGVGHPTGRAGQGALPAGTVAVRVPREDHDRDTPVGGGRERELQAEC
jgi:Family of unknown function (DUF6444)